MANIARITQSVVEIGALEPGNSLITQSVVEIGIGLGIGCGNPPDGQVGQPYSHTFPTGSGDPPFTFSVSATAPPGLLMNAATGELSGLPAVAGSYTFTVTVVDSFSATASVTCSIDVTGTPASPVGGTPFAMLSRGGVQQVHGVRLVLVAGDAAVAAYPFSGLVCDPGRVAESVAVG